MKRLLSLWLLLSSVLFSPLHSLANQTELKVLNFNVWMVKKLGISISSILETERLPLIVDAIQELDPDIILLTEVWNFPLRTQFICKLGKKSDPKFPSSHCSTNEDGGPYEVFFQEYGYGTVGPLGFGDGMMVFSKHPFERRRNGTVIYSGKSFSSGTATEEKQFLGPYSVKKGIFKVTINAGGTLIDLFPFHLGAVYFDAEDDAGNPIYDYRPEHVVGRLDQYMEFESFVRAQRRPNRDHILLGDLNNHFHEWSRAQRQRVRRTTDEYHRITTELEVTDSYMEANRIDLATHQMDELRAMSTFDTVNNDYARDGHFSGIPSEFIDYIFYRPGLKLQAIESRLVMNERITDQQLKQVEPYKSQPHLITDDHNMTPTFLSDHYGVMTTFEISN